MQKTNVNMIFEYVDKNSKEKGHKFMKKHFECYEELKVCTLVKEKISMEIAFATPLCML